MPDLTVLVPVRESEEETETERETESAASETHIVASYATLVSARCVVFAAMLGGSMVEAQTRTLSLGALSQTDHRLFARLLEFLCAQRVSAHTLAETVGLLNLANEYNASELVKKCEGALLRLVCASTVCEILTYAEWLDLDLLRTACYAVLLRCENLHELLTPEVCDAEYVAEHAERERDRDGEVSAEEFRQLAVDVKKKFRTFACSAVHVSRFDVDGPTAM